MNEEKPIGTYQCVACKKVWDGSETYRDSQSIGAQRLTCGDLFCGAIVRRISELPKTEYDDLETKVV